MVKLEVVLLNPGGRRTFPLKSFFFSFPFLQTLLGLKRKKYIKIYNNQGTNSYGVKNHIWSEMMGSSDALFLDVFDLHAV